MGEESVNGDEKRTYEGDSSGFDSDYYSSVELEYEGEELSISVYREHPLKGILVQIGNSSRVDFGFRSYLDMVKLFKEYDRPISVPTWDGGEFSVEYALNSNEDSYTMILHYSTGETMLDFTWHMFLSELQRADFVALSGKVVEYCEGKQAEKTH